MVTANLDGLKQFVCDRPVGVNAGTQQVKAYPFVGDMAMGIKPGAIVGIDRDGDSRLDFYVGTSSEVLNRFVTNVHP
ncbi:MAG: hypothetical protein NUV42_01810, partial [Candidatus Yonathbacteria bacterium]|nr:hypothetical protein [Candidatus Yonathbacteria bacterium]